MPRPTKTYTKAPPGSVTSPTSENPCPRTPSALRTVARQLRSYLDTVQRQIEANPTLETFGRHLDTVSRSYWPGLFHCYAIPGLPRTNNEVESHFRETRRRLLRTTGQQGQTQRTLQREGAWELLPHPPTEANLQEVFRQTPSRTWRRSGNVLLNIASISTGRAVP